MTKDLSSVPLGQQLSQFPSTTTFHTTSSQSSTNSAFSLLSQAAKNAVNPTTINKGRSISAGLAAIYVEHTNLASATNQSHIDTLEHDGEDKLASHVRNRKRDIIPNLIRSLLPEPKIKSQITSPNATIHRLSISSTNSNVHSITASSSEQPLTSILSSNHDEFKVSIHGTAIGIKYVDALNSIEVEHAVLSAIIKSPDFNVQQLAQPAKPCLEAFTQNVGKPIMHVSLPDVGGRIDNTPQLALCIYLLPKALDIVDDQDELQDMTHSTSAHIGWIEAMKQDTFQQDRIRWLGTLMVDEFAKDTSKDSTKIAEMVLLGPVLDKGTYQVDLLQGLVQLVQSAPSGSLVSDDLIKILSILRIRLQGTHGQSSEYSYHLALAVARILDVMAEHEVKNLDRVVEHEPLSGILSGLKGSSDPYLMYQVCYAFQALLYVLDNKTPLEAVLRHSAGLVGGLDKVSAVFQLDLGAILEGLDKLQNSFGNVVDTVVSVFEGDCSLMESGRGVLDSLKDGLGTGKKRTWYAAVCAANALAQAGQLRDLNQLICEAPCRGDPLFQWGTCQLLGEIASDVIWDTSVRLQAIDLLGELYRNDPLWTQDPSVKTWMLNIIGHLGIIDDLAVRTRALTTLKVLGLDSGTTFGLPYPLRNRLPLPTSSPTLARAQKIPNVEYDIRQLQLLRLTITHQSVYIPPLAKPGLKAKDDDLFSLMKEVQRFLASKRQVMLVLGDSGSGKSTFNRHLEHRLWTDYKQGDPIPLYINLPTIDRPEQDMVEKQLRFCRFSDDQIQKLKQHRQFILICDGYDESQQMANLHQTNQFNQPWQWNIKMVISCRTQFLGPGYIDRFKPQPGDRYASTSQDRFQEAVIAPFSKDQVKDYIEQYVQDPETALLFQNRSVWSARMYMDKLAAIPHVMDLVKNPFLLTLALKALPRLVASNKDLSNIRVTRAGLYDMFVDQWLKKNRVRLQTNTLSRDEVVAFNALVESGFIGCGVKYLQRLSAAIFGEQEGNPVVQYVHVNDKHTWKAEFFGTEPEIKLLRDSSPLTRTGNQYRFVHRSILEYCFSCVIYTPARIDDEFDSRPETKSSVFRPITVDNPLFRRDLLADPSVIQFLCDRVRSNPDFEQQLRFVIDQSKTDPVTTIAATNAITILVRAGVPFHGADLRGVRIPGADLSDGQFDHTDFQGADLRRADLSRSWLRQANLRDAQLEGARFGESPSLNMSGYPNVCMYSPDGMLFAVGMTNGLFNIYETTTWSSHLRPYAHVCIAFSSDSQQYVSGDKDGRLRLWDCGGGEALLVMYGHIGSVNSVAFSPCDKRFASAGDDKIVRMWNSVSGDVLFVLEGHTSSVQNVMFSPNGEQLATYDWDETIRCWNVETGEAGVVWSHPSRGICSVVYSPDGRLFACRDDYSTLELWDVLLGDRALCLHGHSDTTTGIAFSPNGQWIASSSKDHTVRLWDGSTGALFSMLTGHRNEVWAVTFSPDGHQIASGGCDFKVRLSEVRSSQSSVEVQGRVKDMRGLVYSFDDDTIISYGSRHSVRRWNRISGASEPVALDFPQHPAVSTMACSSDGKQIATGHIGGSVRLWDVETGVAGPTLREIWSTAVELVFSPCCSWLTIASRNESVRLWDLRDTEKRYDLVCVSSGRGNAVGLTAFSPTGLEVAVGFDNGTVQVFELQGGPSLVFELRRNWAFSLRKDLKFSALAFSPNSRHLAIGTNDLSILIWCLETKSPKFELKGHKARLRCIAYSTCGKWLVSGGDDEVIRLWRREAPYEWVSWWCVSLVQGLFSAVLDLVWNPVTPMEFASACEDGSVRVWRVEPEACGSVAVKLVWSPHLGTLSADCSILKNATGLSHIYEKLLIQRGAIGISSISET
ncbi:hypothetical protein EC957_003997 [Mortierella hygrophila]|uniref:WD40 repeat-like protein n=1 Tax=Mortierella hygrophila TaxID=979708 RepID=A0A9P6K0L2_9FUNG|nr:hypothetical protein EC957_003997 [Mortierella hygrophila]